MPEVIPDSQIPEAASGQSRWSLFLVWLIPVVVALIGAWLATKAIIERGPTIAISFRTAEGLEPGKTRIRYKDVDIGGVKSIALSEDRSMVLVTAQMSKQAERFLVKDTRFWVVRPRIAAGNVSGLSTLLSGAYIGLDAGESSIEARDFTGLEKPPVVIRDLPGREFILHAVNLGSLDIGSPVYYRRVEVGQVVAYELDKDGKGVTLRVFVNSPYDRYVRANSQFWHESGFDVTLDVNGIRLDTETIATLVIAGISFQTPFDSPVLPPAPPNKVFRLSADRAQAMQVSDAISETYVMIFQESVRGLSPGAPVDFRGVVVGEVESVSVDYDAEKKHFTIPVQIRFYPERLRDKYKNGPQTKDTKRMLDRLVERGFRGQLRMGSLVTQQLYIALDFFPDASKAKIDWTQDPPALPTVSGSLEELQATLTSILKKLDKVPLDEIGKDLRVTLKTLNSTLGKADKLFTRFDAEVAPELVSTLKDARSALGSVESALTSDAPIQQDMRETLRELTRAAQSLRTLADYLERHPESILHGKQKERTP